jgi:5,10-methylenetetrahydromethanopterin reductase
VKFAVHSSSSRLSEVRGRAKRAELLGFDAFFVADSQLNLPDPFQALALAAEDTERVLLATAVTNMVYRDATVIASSAATLNEASGGRAILGLGTGDGPVYSQGRHATRMAEFAEQVGVARALLNDEGLALDHGQVYLRSGCRPVPIFLSVEGPKGLRVAGALADGLLLGSGFDLEVLKSALNLAFMSATEAGRDSSALSIVAAGMCVIDEDGDRARRLVRSRIANRAHHNFRFGLHTVPPQEVDGVAAFMTAFDIRKPLEQRVPVDLVSPYLIERFSLAGTAAEVVTRVRALEDAGVGMVMLTPPENLFDEVVEQLATKVLPAFASGSSPATPA